MNEKHVYSESYWDSEVVTQQADPYNPQNKEMDNGIRKLKNYSSIFVIEGVLIKFSSKEF